jgi:hypothetical protein
VLAHCYNSADATGHIMFGATGAKGRENPNDLHYLNLDVTVTGANEDPRLQKGEVYSLQLGLSTQQMAQIVQEFFQDTVNDYRLQNPKANIWMRMLRRLIKRRWQIMSGETLNAAFKVPPSYTRF